MASKSEVSSRVGGQLCAGVEVGGSPQPSDCGDDGPGVDVHDSPVLPPSPGLADIDCADLPEEQASSAAGLSADLLAEERQLELLNLEETRRLQRQHDERVRLEEREQRFSRLMKLLHQSQFYVRYLSDKIDSETRRRTADAQQQQKSGAASDASSSRRTHKSAAKGKAAGKRVLRARAGGAKSDDTVEEQCCSSQDSSQECAPVPLCTAAGAGDELRLPQPRLLEGATLRDYQLRGYNWLRLMYTNGVNCILGDEMGLGKTVQAISVIAHLVEQAVRGPFLVVAPLSTLTNWLSELRRFTPRLPTLLYHGAERHQLLAQLDTAAPCARPAGDSGGGGGDRGQLVDVWPVVLTSYEVVLRDSQQLSRYEWKYLVVDEGHRLKNHRCRLVGELRRLRVYNRLLLTGTPLQNDLAELWSLLNFLLPEIFDDLAVFESWFDVNDLTAAQTAAPDGADARLVAQERETHVLATLRTILAPFLLRRLKSDVAVQIPPKRELVVHCPMVARQAQMYRAAVQRTMEQLLQRQHAGAGDTKENQVLADNDSDIGDDGEAGGRGRRKRAKLERKCRTGTDFTFLFSGSRSLGDWHQGVQRMMTQREAARLRAATRDPAASRSRLHLPLQSMMMLLRHIANHPFLVEHPLDADTKELLLVPDVAEHSGKMKVLDALLHGLFNEPPPPPVGAAEAAASNAPHSGAAHCQRKVLIFSQFRMMLSVLADYLTVKGWRFVQLDGTMSVHERQRAIDRFNRPAVNVTDSHPLRGQGQEEEEEDDEQGGANIFLISTRAGGLGINLSSADTVIIYDSDWNPQRDLQAQDRAHRLGQTRPVVVYRLVTAGTIDERIVQRATCKRKLERVLLCGSSSGGGGGSGSAKVATGRKDEKNKQEERVVKEVGAATEDDGDDDAASTAAAMGVERLKSDELLQLLRDTESQQMILTDSAALTADQLHHLLDRSQLYAEWKRKQ